MGDLIAHAVVWSLSASRTHPAAKADHYKGKYCKDYVTLLRTVWDCSKGMVNTRHNTNYKQHSFSKKLIDFITQRLKGCWPY